MSDQPQDPEVIIIDCDSPVAKKPKGEPFQFNIRQINFEYVRALSMGFDEYAYHYKNTFSLLNTVKRNGFHIIAVIDDDTNELQYRTQKMYPLAGAAIPVSRKRPVQSTLAKIDKYLRETLDCKFTPADVLSPRSEPASKLRFEFCVQEKGSGKDNLQALLHGKWCKNPEAYDVSIAVFDVEFFDGPDLRYMERWKLIHDAFPDNVVQRIQTVDAVRDTLKHCEGIVTYDLEGFPYKVKLDHPVSLVIIAAHNTMAEQFPKFKGYNRVYIGVQTGDKQYLVLHVIDYEEVFSDHERIKKGKCYVNPGSIKRDPKTGHMGCFSKSVLGPVLNGMTKVLETSQKWKSEDSRRITVFTPTRVVFKFGDEYTLNYEIHGGRSFGFNKGCHFYDPPPPIVVSANEIWSLPGGGLHFQATKVLAVGVYGDEIHRELLDKPTSLKTIERIAFERLCQDPDTMNELVFGEGGVDLMEGYDF